MSVSDAWTNATPASAARKNRTSVISDTGSNLAALDKTKFKIVTATTTASGFIKDHAYLFNEDATQAIDLTATLDHNHSGTTSGGDFMQILRNNENVVDTGYTYIGNHIKSKYDSNILNGSGSSLTDSIDGSGERYIEFDTGTTSGGNASLRNRSLEWDCSKNSWFKSLQQFTTASSLAEKCGLGMEFLYNSDDNERKYGYEICTTVNNNFFSVSANGTTRSSSDTGVAMDTNRTSFRMKHFPGTPDTTLQINEGTAFTKTTNIPTSYTNDLGVNTMPVISFKSNTASSRIMKWYAMRICYTTSTKWDEQ